MNENVTSKRGITLIALIITIIILLILAMVTINILINQGIIGHANNAVRGYEVAEEKELIGLGYQNYKMDKLHDSNAELTVDGATVAKDDEVNGWYITFTKTKHNYSLSDNGTIEQAGEKWLKNQDGSYSKGDATIKIGDYVDYDPSAEASGELTYTSLSYTNRAENKNEGRSSGYSEDQTFDASTYNKGWLILGVTGGSVELISANSVGDYALNAQYGYQYGPDELQSIASIYGKGKGAIGGRNLTIDEVNSITGYDPEHPADGKNFREGTLAEYGNEVTYYWTGDDMPYGAGTNGKSWDSLKSHGSGFFWFEDLRGTAYNYHPYTLTERYPSQGGGYLGNNKALEALWHKEDYWLASRCIRHIHNQSDSGGANYELYYIFSNSANSTVSWKYVTSSSISSSGNSNYYPLGVRPVVTLSPSVKLKTDTTHDGKSATTGYIIEQNIKKQLIRVAF